LLAEIRGVVFGYRHLPIVKKGRSIEIATARGKALGDDLGAVTGTSLDKGVELDALAKLAKTGERASRPALIMSSNHY
jgi:hypothetical protein